MFGFSGKKKEKENDLYAHESMVKTAFDKRKEDARKGKFIVDNEYPSEAYVNPGSEMRNSNPRDINPKREFTYDPKKMIRNLSSLRNVKNYNDVLDLIYNESYQLAQIFRENNSALDFNWVKDIQDKNKEEIAKKILNNNYSSLANKSSSHFSLINTENENPRDFWKNRLIINNKLNLVNVSLYRLKILAYAYYTLYVLQIGKKDKNQKMVDMLLDQFYLLNNFLNYFNFDNIDIYKISNDSIEISKRLKVFNKMLNNNSILKAA